MVIEQEKSVSEAIQYRRSIRLFKKEAIDQNKVRDCIQLASLAPTSSNMQLREFYHVVCPIVIKQIAKASFDQNAAKTAQQLVIVVTRKDL
jgi:nitroreductase